MAIFSFLHRLVCKKCKTTIGSHRSKRREERLQRLGKTKTQTQEQEQDEWKPSWVRETARDVENFNEHDSDEDNESSSVAQPDTSSPSSSQVSVSTSSPSSSVSSLAPFSPSFPDFSEPVATALPIVPARPTATTPTKTAVTTDRNSTSSLSISPTLSTLSTSSSLSSLTRVSGARDLRRLSNNSPYTAPYSPSHPPRLMLTWQHTPPSPLIVGPQFCNSPIFVPMAFVDVKRLPRLSMGQRFPLLLLDDSDEDSDSGETISSSSPSSSPASSSSPVSPSFSLSSTSFVSPVSPRSPVVPASPILDKPLPALPIELSTPSSPRINGNKVSPLAGRRISAGDNSNTLAGPRYVPSSKTAPRPRVAAQRPTLQQTLPFLRTSTTFDDILALKTSSSFNSTPLTFDEILGSSTRPEPKLIHRKPVPVFSPKVEKPAEPTASKQIITRHASQIIRPYDQTRSQSKRRAQRVVPLSVLAPSSSSANTTSPQVNRLVPYNSHHGYSLLQTLRRLLIIPTDWSPTQTLLFILQHPAVRHLALPFHLSSSPQSDYFQDLLGIPRCNALDWYGILQAIDGPIRYHAARKRSQQSLKLRAVPPTLAPCSNPRALSTNTPFSSAERDLVARWLAGGEPLFTGRMTLPAVLLRKSGKPLTSTGRTQQQSRARTPLSPLASSSVRTNDDQAASSLPPLDPATRYDISRNPRCRYHQVWTGAGKSHLSVTMLAEIEV